MDIPSTGMHQKIDALNVVQIVNWLRENPQWQFYGAIGGGEMGLNKDWRPSALLIGGYDRTTGVLDVVEADIRARPLNRFIDDLIASQFRYECLLWVVEMSGYRQIAMNGLTLESARFGLRIPLRGVKLSREAPAQRVAALWPSLNDGLIRLHKSQTVLTRNLVKFGKFGYRMDAPLALEMLWRAIQGRGIERSGNPSNFMPTVTENIEKVLSWKERTITNVAHVMGRNRLSLV
ncbi:MAG: hypothetical protein H7832_13540 [Magnetococcus sp. DMHC-6]